MVYSEVLSEGTHLWRLLPGLVGARSRPQLRTHSEGLEVFSERFTAHLSFLSKGRLPP